MVPNSAPQNDISASLAHAIHHAASRAALSLRLGEHGPLALAVTLLYEQFHLLAADTVHEVATAQELECIVGVGEGEYGDPTIAYGLADPESGRRAIVVFPDEIEGLLGGQQGETQRLMQEAGSLLRAGELDRAREVVHTFVTRQLGNHVQEQFEQTATALVLCRSLPVERALQEAARLSDSGPHTSA